MTSEFIKQKAIEYGATVCGIGNVELMRNEPIQRNPFSILPKAKSIIGFGIKIPNGLYNAMDDKRQYFNYVNLGVKYIDEVFAEIFLLKMGRLIEDEGYDACLQRSIPGFKIKGDETTNPEVAKIYQLQFASAVSPDKAVPDVIINPNKAAEVCGLGKEGMHGKVIVPKYGTQMRFVYIITDMELDYDKPFTESLCDKCGKCLNACPGNAISSSGVDSWQCSVYYRGAHKSNPFITDEFLKNNPEREAILNGEKKFDKESAQAIYPELKFLPEAHFGYVPCLCARSCESVCNKHLKESGKL
ncbi:MAG: epoxyqueuosine reductase [Clostridia bacterium]|nr:epoxyqueuosine reductase [Clostridia bacterium]